MKASLTDNDYHQWFIAPPIVRLEAMRGSTSKYSTLGILVGDQFKIVSMARAVIPPTSSGKKEVAGWVKKSGKQYSALFSSHLILDSAYGVVDASDDICGGIIKKGGKVSKATLVGPIRLSKGQSIGIFPVAIPLPPDHSVPEGKITSAAVWRPLMYLNSYTAAWQEAAAKTLPRKEGKRNISSVDLKSHSNLEPGPVFSVRDDGFDIGPPAVALKILGTGDGEKIDRCLEGGKWCELPFDLDMTYTDV